MTDYGRQSQWRDTADIDLDKARELAGRLHIFTWGRWPA